MSHSSGLVLDSYALMVLFQQERGFIHIEHLFKKVKENHRPLKMSSINVGEVFYSVYKSKGNQAAQQALILIEQMSIAIIDVSRDMVLSAALIKAQYPLSYADAFVVAVAQYGGDIIVTGDKEFKAVEKIVDIEWIK